MENFENHLARLGYRIGAHDPEYWRVAQVERPKRKPCRRDRSMPAPTGGRRNLYMWILQSSAPTEPYRVTRLADR